MSACVNEISTPEASRDLCSAMRGADRIAARSVFDLELARLDLLIHREMLRLRARYELTLDEYRGLYVSDQQVESLLRGADAGAMNRIMESMHARITASQAALETRTDASGTPWKYLQTQLSLSRIECDLVLLALAPELDAKYENLFAYLNNDVSWKLPTAELACRLFAADASERGVLRELVGPESRLTGMGLIERSTLAREGARMQRGLRVTAAVVDWLLGLPYVDDRLVDLMDWKYTPTTTLSAHGPEFTRCVRSLEGLGPVCSLIVAPSTEDAVAAADEACRLAKRVSLHLDLLGVRAASAPAEAMRAVGLAARLFDACVVASPLEALVDGEGRSSEAQVFIARQIARRLTRLVWCGSDETRWREVLGNASRTAPDLIVLKELTAAERAEAWRTALGESGSAAPVAALADRFAFGAAQIERIARRVLQSPDPVHAASDRTRLFEAARAASLERAAGVSRSVTTVLNWDDLVMPKVVKHQLQDFVRAAELRPRVLDEWGFARRLDNARGCALMLKGVSGGGKTLSAKLIAKSLALDLHRVELSAVISKYIGETEKNLDRAFEAARRANAILFMDEADALFGKRSEVKDAHDRYANVETAYLLQKLEEHIGIVILATNLANNIDEAFLRRIQYVIEIPMPDAPCRVNLWRVMLPPSAPVAEDVDLVFLGEQFEFPGGDIRNMALDAAYLAAQDGGLIHMRHLLAAITRQYAKRGKVPTAAEFREYLNVVSQGVSGRD